MAMANWEFTVELKGQYGWELLLSMDNATNTVPIKREMEIESEVSFSYVDMVHSLGSSPLVRPSFGPSRGRILLDVTRVSVKGELTSPEVKTEYENLPQTKEEAVTKTGTKDIFEVGANSSSNFYQMVFKGPGIFIKTDKTSSSTRATLPPEVPIEIKGRLLPVLKDIEVVYTSDAMSRPEDIIKEARGYDPDINKEWNDLVAKYQGSSGFRKQQSYVWLKPIWTVDVSKGVTGIQVAVQSERDDNYNDLAKGAGGDFRYLKMIRDPNSKHRITEIALWRRPDGSVEELPPDLTYSGPYEFNADINGGRFGQVVPMVIGGFPLDCKISFEELFLVWNVREIQIQQI